MEKALAKESMLRGLQPGDGQELKQLDRWVAGRMKVGMIVEKLLRLIDRLCFQDREPPD
jgi:hypothetical protein